MGGTYNFYGSVTGAVGEGAVYVGDVPFADIVTQLDKLYDVLARNGIDDEIALNTANDAIVAAKNGESDKLTECLKTLGGRVRPYITEFSISFLSAALTKVMFG